MLTAATVQIAACLKLARALARTETIEEVYAIALDVLSEPAAVTRSSILLLDDDGVMRFGESRGLTDAFRQALEGTLPWTADTLDPQPVVVSDVTLEPALARHLAKFQADGIAALVFMPLVSLGRVTGAIVLGYDRPDALEADAVQMATLVASQVAFAAERTRALEHARRSESRLRFALDAVNMGMWEWDLRSQSIRWSENLERIHGMTPGSFDGTFESYEREIHADDRAHVLASLQQTLSDGTPYEVEYRIVAPDGTVRWVEGKGTVERGADGQPIRLSGVCVNVTPRKEAELARVQALEQSNEASHRLAAIVESSGDAIVSKTLDGVITSWNRAAERLFGYTAEEAIGRSITLIIPQDRLAEEDIVLSRVRAGLQVEMETIRRRKDGTLVPISLMVSAIKDGERIVGASKIARDISARKRDEAERAELHEQVRTQRNAAEAGRRRAAFLADATAILSRSLDYEQTLAALARLAVPGVADWCAVDIVADNGELQRLAVAHVDPAKVDFARTLHERYPPDPDARGGIHDVIRTGRPVLVASIPLDALASHARDETHLRMLTELGPTSYMCVPLVSARGTFGAMTFVHAESGRHYSAGDLAFAQELTTHAALAIENAFAYRRVTEASRLKDEFLATLSHELRTPLNAILGYAQMLNDGVVTGERSSSAMSVLMRNADALKQIIEDLLDVSRITSAKLRLNVQRVDLRDILTDAVATIQPAADAKRVSVQTVLGAATPPVSGDPDRLQQVVWNLLSNAVKFTPRGGHVELRLQQVDASIQIIVKDNGQGVDRAFLPHMFKRFRQADSRFSREHGGLGLGLAIVRELTELHGGTVLAASDGPGTGATFTVSLPLARASSASRASEREAEPTDR